MSGPLAIELPAPVGRMVLPTRAVLNLVDDEGRVVGSCELVITWQVATDRAGEEPHA